MQQFQFDNVATGSSIGISALEKDGQAWFVANDVCNALGLHRTATRRLDDDEKGVHKTHTLGGLQEVAIINESGLYSLIFSSNKAAAKVFKKWITAPTVKQEASSKAAWWEMQVQEAVTMFRLNPSQDRFDSVGALADQYTAWKTSPRR